MRQAQKFRLRYFSPHDAAQMQRELNKIRVLSLAYFRVDIRGYSVGDILKAREDIKVYLKANSELLETSFANAIYASFKK